MFEANDVRHDCIIERTIIALRNRNRYAFVLIIDLYEYLWRFQIFNLLFDQLICWFFD